jgi:Alpha-galactosidase
MPILNDAENLKFHLYNDTLSYVVRICAGRYPENLYYGKRVRDRRDVKTEYRDNARALTACVGGIKEYISLHHLAHEYPTYGTSDFHYPAFSVRQENGSRASDFIYESYRVLGGKDSISPLPSVYAENPDEAESLEISLVDPASGMRLVLTYSVFASLSAITRSARFLNASAHPASLDRAMSFSLIFPDSDFEMLHLSGAWARERNIRSRPLVEGIQSIHSLCGISSADHNPFIALKRRNADEDSGEAFGFSLVYSGNFLGQVEADSFGRARIMMGIHPDAFNWTLKPGETFQTPEAVLVYSSEGLNAMSQTFHDLYRTRLARGYWRDRDRPVILNNWEATGFDFNEERILKMATSAKDLGIELFVLDDGWFGKRNNDAAGLGDWYANREKLPGGVKGIAEKIHALGLSFGIWIEPEMVNADSDLFRDHPDWILRVPGREPSLARNQFVLDFSRPVVVDYVGSAIETVLREAKVSYVKWDMNRYITDCWSSETEPALQGSVFHRYILGVYGLYERLMKAFPEILFESCSAGGARFDPGILSFAPQTWTSDDTDAIERLRIQYGTSVVYPLSSMGNHVSDIPNQQVGRNTPLDTRGKVALFGVLGYELDPCVLDGNGRTQIRKQIEMYKKYRTLVRTGLFFRIASPFRGNVTAWTVVSRDRTESIAACYRVLNMPNSIETILKFRGLNPDWLYSIENRNGKEYCGGELMYAGLRITPEDWNVKGDFASTFWHLRASP